MSIWFPASDLLSLQTLWVMDTIFDETLKWLLLVPILLQFKQSGGDTDSILLGVFLTSSPPPGISECPFKYLIVVTRS